MRNLKRVLSLALALVMVLGMMVITTSAATFTDAEEITNTEAVEVLAKLGIVAGMGDGTFNPTGTFTREQAAKMITYMKLGADTAEKLAGTDVFTDVAASKWSAKYIGYCANLGIIAGVGDNKFNPGGKLTDIALGKMLLVALGYDSVDYVGSNWATAVTVDLLEAGLVDSVTGTEISREDACAMILAAMLYTETPDTWQVRYTDDTKANYDVIGEFDTLLDATMYLKLLANDYAVASVDAGLDNIADNDDDVYVGEGYYVVETPANDDLLYDVYGWTCSDGTDAYGRPATVYTKGAQKMVYVETPDMSSTTTITAAELYNTLGYKAKVLQSGSAITANGITADKFIVNGTQSAADYAVSALSGNIGGNGIVTEIYNVDSRLTPNVVEYIAVQIQPTLYKLGPATKVPATSTKGAYTRFTVGGTNLDEYTSVVNAATDKTNFVTDAPLAKDDYVFVYGNTGAGYTVTHAATVTGKMTAKNTATRQYTIADTNYKASAAVAGSGLTTAIGSYANYTTPATFIVDDYGYVMGSITVNVPDNYLYVLKAGEDVYTLEGTSLKTSVSTKVVNTDGTISEVTVSTVDGSAASTGDGGNVITGLYTYSVHPVTGAYALTTVTANTDSALANNSPVVATGTPNVYANADTKFLVVNWTAGTAAVKDRTDGSGNHWKIAGITTLTGYENIGRLTSVVGEYIDADGNGIAELVFVYTNGTPGATADWIYYLGTYAYDGSTYTYNVIKDGEITAMTSTDISAGLTTSSPAGLYSLSSGTASALASTSVYNGTTFSGEYCTSGITYKLQNKGGLLYMTTSTRPTTENFLDAIAGTVPVYTVSAATGAVTVGTAADLATPATANQVTISANVAGNAIGAIWMIVD